MRMWKAYYSDGKTLDQYGINGKSGYENIDRTKLAAFAIINRTYQPDPDFFVPLLIDGKMDSRRWHLKVEDIIFRVHLKPEQRLIYRLLGVKRVFKDTMQSASPDEHIFMVGWQQKVNGTNIQSVNYLTEDGRIEQMGEWLGKEPIFLEGEKLG